MRYGVAMMAVVAVTLLAALPAALGVAQSPVPSPVYISEFISDPEESGNDGAFEWLELANSSDGEVTLSGWVIGDAKLDDALPEITIPAGGFVVVAGKSAVFGPEVSAVRLDDGLIGGGLNNGEDVIRLLNESGAEVDRAEYGPGTLIVPPGAGYSMVRKEDGGWRLAVNPSPGAPNVLPSDAEIEQQFPIPVEFQVGDQSTSRVAYFVFAAAVTCGIIGTTTLLMRWKKRKPHRAV